MLSSQAIYLFVTGLQLWRLHVCTQVRLRLSLSKFADMRRPVRCAGCGSQSGVDIPFASVMIRNASQFVTFEGVEIAWVSGWGATVESGASSIAFEGCYIHDVGAGAFANQGNNCADLMFCSFSLIGGIRGGSTGGSGVIGLHVTDCTIERGGSVLPASPGILLQV